jgi:intracellular septation protein
MTFEAAPNTPERAIEKKELNPLLKLVLELGPLGIFFFVNTRFGIFWATGFFMVAVTIALAISYILIRRLPIMPVISGIVVLVFGGIALWLQNDTFIKIKPTIVNTLFGAILLGGLAFGKPLLGYVLDSVFRLTDKGWWTLTLRWGVFFLVLAVLNEIVWRNFSTDFWVSFKVFGTMPLTLLFTFSQIPLINRESLDGGLFGKPSA